MDTHYDPRTDTLTLRLGTAPVDHRREGGTGVILHCDAQGQVVRLELRDASCCVEDLK